jgi:ABC-type multidrug transport system fused ATPase/permease subunit
MRKLSELEIQKIDQRLKSLKIRYIEIYEEIRDHYITALEQVSLEKFDAKKEVLDDEFAWSVVRKMEKELSKQVSKQVLVAQLDFLKFWNHGIKGLLIAFVTLTALVISIFSIPPSELILVFLAIIICTAVGVFIIKRDALSFSLSHKTVCNCSSKSWALELSLSLDLWYAKYFYEWSYPNKYTICSRNGNSDRHKHDIFNKLISNSLKFT